MSSINAATIGTLVNAITGGLTSGQTYDLMRKISEDLDDVFSTVNTGPLKAVDASALLHINPVNIDSPGDIPPLVSSPGKVAFVNWANVFTPVQSFQSHITLASGVAIWTPDTSAATNLRFYVDTNDVILRMGPGAFKIQNNTGVQLWTSYPSGAFATGNIGVDPGVLGFCLFNTLSLYGRNAANNANLKIALIDSNDVIRLADDANSGSRIGHMGIPAKTTANLPPAGASSDGIIAIDKTLNKLCYWVMELDLPYPQELHSNDC
jgi:hypothetical protein